MKTYQVRRDGPYTHLSVFIDGEYLAGATAPAVNFLELTGWLAAKHPDAKAGFWDRGAGEAGDRLSKASRAAGERYVYVSDAGELGIE